MSDASATAIAATSVGAGVGDSPWGPTPPAFAQLPRLDFVMTPSDMSKGEFGVLSRDVSLNGQRL